LQAVEISLATTCRTGARSFVVWVTERHGVAPHHL